MSYVRISLEDADLVLLVVEAGEPYDEKLFARFKNLAAPLLLLINKIDLVKPGILEERTNYWKQQLNPKTIIPVSAKTGKNVDRILTAIKELLPAHPGYYPKDDLTDRSERFFASEIIREKILLNYEQEIPYSVEVGVESFKDEETIIRIRAIIYVERESQKGILIGKGGMALKKVGTAARIDLEKFFAKKVFLETRVKVSDDWRRQKQKLKQFGYME